MALPASGTITLAQIQTEFGGSNPIGLNEYYKGGAYVKTTDNAPNVPASGTISLSNFWGASKNTFTPVTRTYTTGTAATETAPTGASNVVIAVWGAGGGGSAGFNSTEPVIPEAGAGGGSGGYSQSQYTISGGQTLIYSVGSGGSAGGATAGSGTASTVSSGTRAITTMTANGGAGGVLTTLTPGVGGTASGGNTQNTSGSSGDFPYGGNPVVGLSSLSGGSGGSAGTGVGNPGDSGSSGLIVFYYT